MNKIYNPTKDKWDLYLQRPTIENNKIQDITTNVFEIIEKTRDQGIRECTLLYDKVELKNFQVSELEIMQAFALVPEELKQAIQLAKFNIQKFHEAQKTSKINVETTEGVFCWQEKRPIQKVGLYIPGGTAPLFSTVLMLAIPAQIAGCKEIVLCSPPDQNGNLNPAIIYAANLCGVTQIFKVGGIQAIAGMTFGTDSIPKVYKIFGPGNQYVTAAKQYAMKFGVAIDLPAGPSELLIVADSAAVASFVAADLLSQAEHGVDSQVILISTSRTLIDEVELEINMQIEKLPRRTIAEQAINNSRFIFVENDQTALELINEYAPEHLIICVKNEDFFVDNVENAGSIFIGNFTPESAGDYASGTNHTLPNNGYAKNYSGVSLDSFLKSMTFQKITRQGLENIGKAIEIMAESEGLQAHKNAVSLRLKSAQTSEMLIK